MNSVKLSIIFPFIFAIIFAFIFAIIFDEILLNFPFCIKTVVSLHSAKYTINVSRLPEASINLHTIKEGNFLGKPMGFPHTTPLNSNHHTNTLNWYALKLTPNIHPLNYVA